MLPVRALRLYDNRGTAMKPGIGERVAYSRSFCWRLPGFHLLGQVHCGTIAGVKRLYRNEDLFLCRVAWDDGTERHVLNANLRRV